MAQTQGTTKELFIPKYVKRGMLIVLSEEQEGQAQYRAVGLDPVQSRNLLKDVFISEDARATAYIQYLISEAYERGKIAGAEEFSKMAEQSLDAFADGVAAILDPSMNDADAAGV